MPKSKKPKTILETVFPLRKMFSEYKGIQMVTDGVETTHIAVPSADCYPVPVRIYKRTQPGDNLPVFVYYHGGGFFGGSPDIVEQMCKLLVVNYDCIVFNVEYRLCPENHYPAPLDDCFYATRWAHAHAAEFGGDSSRLAVGGDSAGGNLAAAVTLRDLEEATNMVKAQVLLYPAVNISGQHTEFYHGVDSTKYHRSNKHKKVLDAVLGMLWLAAPIGVATILTFLVPNLGVVGQYIYIAITYNLVTTVLYTAINIPYGALTARMSRDQNQRMIINVFRMFMAQVGSLAINAFTLPFVKAMGGDAGTGNQRAWVIVSCVYGGVAALLFLLCFFNTKERVDVPSEKVSFFKSLKICFKNDQWLLLVVVWVVMILGLSMSMGVGTYYAKYWLGDEAYVGFLAAIGILVALIVMPVMTVFIKKHGKRNVALVGAIITFVGQLMFLINPVSFPWLVFCSVIKGVGSATAMGTMFAMIADSIEYGQWKTGTRVEGMLYSTTTFGAKIGGGVGGAVAMGILGIVGYNGLQAVQTPAAMEAIKTLYLIVPLPFLALLPFIYGAYKLDKIYPKVMQDLAEGKTKDSQ